MIDQETEPQQRIEVRAELKAPRAAGIAGLAFAVLFTAALIALRQQPLAYRRGPAITAGPLRRSLEFGP